MNLETRYLGLKLRTPLVVGASPFSENTRMARKLQDAGAGALVMRSLFQEQIEASESDPTLAGACGNDRVARLDPAFDQQLSPPLYLRQIEDLKGNLTIPVIASLNGNEAGNWIDFAHRIEHAGADAIELNLYRFVTDPALSGSQVESSMLAMTRRLAATVSIPIAVKLSPFHTALAHFVSSLEEAGARAVVLFNRVYQPDFNIDEVSLARELRFSDSAELLSRLRWVSILAPRARISLAAAGGVNSPEDVIKAILAGADAVQVVSVLLRHGPLYLTTLVRGLNSWMERKGYEELQSARGALGHRGMEEAAALERTDYIKLLQSWSL